MDDVVRGRPLILFRILVHCSLMDQIAILSLPIMLLLIKALGFDL